MATCAPSSLTVYQHFDRPVHPHYSFTPQQDAHYSNQMAHQQSKVRRKRLEDALTEVVPSSSRAKMSQRIAQLQHSLNAPAPRRMHPSARPLSLNPAKDYSQPLAVDCSIEYDLHHIARPPPGAEPLLVIARRPLPVHVVHFRQHQAFQPSSQFTLPDYDFAVVDASSVVPVSSSGSEDSGRGTDSERVASPLRAQLTGWMPCVGWMQPQQQTYEPLWSMHNPQHPLAGDADTRGSKRVRHSRNLQ